MSVDPIEAAVEAAARGAQNGTDPHGMEVEVSTWEPLDLIEAASAAPEGGPPSILRTADGSSALFYAGVRHLLLGPPESLKSMIALAAGREVMALGRRVVWLDMDAMGPRDTLERLRAFGCDDTTVREHFVYVAPESPLDEAGRIVIERLTADRPPHLVVIDAQNPALVLHGLKSTVMEDVELLTRMLVLPWQRAGAAVLVLDHVVKNPEERGMWAFGAERKVGVMQAAYGLVLGKGGRLTRTRAATVIIQAHKDRPGWHKRGAKEVIGQITFTPDPETGRLNWLLELAAEGKSTEGEDGPDAFRPTVLMERVSRFLEIQHEPVSKTAVEKDVKGRAGFVRQALDRLVVEGYVVTEEGPRSATLHRSERPYREADDTTPSDSVPPRPDPVPDGVTTPSRTHPSPLRGEGPGTGSFEDGRTGSPRPISEGPVSEQQLEVWEDLVAEGRANSEENAGSTAPPTPSLGDPPRPDDAREGGRA